MAREIVRIDEDPGCFMPIFSDDEEGIHGGTLSSGAGLMLIRAVLAIVATTMAIVTAIVMVAWVEKKMGAGLMLIRVVLAMAAVVIAIAIVAWTER